jgi:hypothetical protein
LWIFFFFFNFTTSFMYFLFAFPLLLFIHLRVSTVNCFCFSENVMFALANFMYLSNRVRRSRTIKLQSTLRKKSLIFFTQMIVYAYSSDLTQSSKNCECSNTSSNSRTYPTSSLFAKNKEMNK